LGRQILEKKNLGNETLQNRISQQKRLEIRALVPELVLYAADEYFQTGHRHVV